MPSAPRRLLPGRGLVTAAGTLVIALALAAPMLLPRDGGHGMGPWLPMGRILEPDHAHSRSPSVGPSDDRSAEDTQARAPSGARAWEPLRRGPVLPQRPLAPRRPDRDRRPHTGVHHGHGLLSPWQHLQCKVLHRHC